VNSFTLYSTNVKGDDGYGDDNDFAVRWRRQRRRRRTRDIGEANGAPTFFFGSFTFYSVNINSGDNDGVSNNNNDDDALIVQGRRHGQQRRRHPYCRHWQRRRPTAWATTMTPVQAKGDGVGNDFIIFILGARKWD
jgi:hypothetical protein